jgi:hypothetical protein
VRSSNRRAQDNKTFPDLLSRLWQSIGLALKPPALGCAWSEVIDHQERVLGDKRQNLVEIRRARPRARQTMGGESRGEVLLQQGSQSGLEPARRLWLLLRNRIQ